MKLKKAIMIPLSLLIAIQIGCKKQPSEKEEDVLEFLDVPTVMMIDSTNAEISWTTNYPSNSVVYYGLTVAFEDTVFDDEERELHKVTVADLVPDTIYYFQVESTSDYFPGTASSDVDTFTTGMNELSYTMIGWRHFSDGDYANALTAFETAMQGNATYGEAFVGRGWCYIRLENLASALTDFDTGLGFDNTILVGYAGRALTHLAQQSYSEAIADARVVIDADSVYQFSYDTNIDHILVRLVLVQAYYATQDYESAQAQCNKIDPNNGLDPVLPGSWVVNGVTYGSYNEALLGLIQYLVLQQGGG